MALKESDFPQFPDPRVREVMAAAARVVEWYEEQFPYSNLVGRVWVEALKTALFAAQHSKPKETPEHFEARVLDAIAGYPSLEKPKCDWSKNRLRLGESDE